MPNRSIRDEMQNKFTQGTGTYDPTNPDGTKQVSPPTRSAFDSDPPPQKAGPVQKTPQPVSTAAPEANPGTSPGADLTIANAARTIQARKAKIDSAIDDAS